MEFFSSVFSEPLFNEVRSYTYGHSSSSNERTRVICVPRFLWIPEHSIQMRAPRFRLAQSGSKK